MSHLEPELLSAYVDDAVDATERAHIEAHLPGCDDCRAQLDALGFVRTSARTLERPTIPELHRKQLWREINRTRRAPATKWRALVAVAGTAAAIAAFAGLTMLGSTSGPNVRALDISVEDAGSVSARDLESYLATTMFSSDSAITETGGGASEGIGATDPQAPTAAAAPAPTIDGQRAEDAGSDASKTVNHGAQIARCEEIIEPGGEGGAIAIRYLVATYRGSEAYVLVYDIPRADPTHREVFVVTRTECEVLAHRSSV